MMGGKEEDDNTNNTKKSVVYDVIIAVEDYSFSNAYIEFHYNLGFIYVKGVHFATQFIKSCHALWKIGAFKALLVVAVIFNLTFPCMPYKDGRDYEKISAFRNLKAMISGTKHIFNDMLKIYSNYYQHCWHRHQRRLTNSQEHMGLFLVYQSLAKRILIEQLLPFLMKIPHSFGSSLAALRLLELFKFLLQDFQF